MISDPDISSVAFGLPFRSAHLVGIGGSGMKSLAEILLDAGCAISGSDCDPSRMLADRFLAAGVTVQTGHDAKFVPQDADALIYSPAISANNPERQRAAEWSIRQFALPQALQILMQSRVGIAVAGTHGKSTTSAMIAWILERADQSPSAYFGAELLDRHRGGWLGGGEQFVVESCEYQRNFLQLRPAHAVILGIEPDHFETYPQDAALIDAFTEFAQHVPNDGVLILNGDCQRSMQVAAECGINCETVGLQADSDWRCNDIRFTNTGSRFCVTCGNQRVAEVALPLFGRHNVHNALAAAAMCLRLGVPASTVECGLRDFPGIARRFELLGDWNGMTLIDDYAHHPTAVRETLTAARQGFAGRRLWCVFQPHQTARVNRLMPEFSAALAIADRALISPAYSARETGRTEATICSQKLVQQTREIGTDCRFISSLDRILPSLEDEARPGDVVVLMGAGDIERIRHEFARRIPRNHADQCAAGGIHLAENRRPGRVSCHAPRR